MMLKTLVSRLMIATMLFLGIQAPSMATMVGTQDLAMQVELQQQRDSLQQLIAREDIQTALLDYGVDMTDVENRIENMTATEMLQVQAQLDALPAGSGAAGLILGVILILVLLDLLGATDVFPRI